MTLFWSNDDLRRLQAKELVHRAKGYEPSPEVAFLREAANEREVREHQRWRQFAFILFVLPWVAVLFFVALLLVIAYFSGRFR